ncbi:serine protease inhibitor Cvsi-2-like [Mya arenaria]|uniref:serine protease inhibitor Cvsi-2-like n=1 Tax=Mya arenaria TaxID=6604 RepID=UPI0022E0799A|nr:serine protease inhibitor Cvsi-2-like [Mya arenaria]
MKIALSCVVVLACLALAYGEECRDTGDCSHVTCPENDYVLECHNRQCTCTHTTAMCTAATDCSANKCDRDWHCVDGRCRCGFGFGGQGR